jgi:hypothetical protein
MLHSDPAPVEMSKPKAGREDIFDSVDKPLVLGVVDLIVRHGGTAEPRTRRNINIFELTKKSGLRRRVPSGGTPEKSNKKKKKEKDRKERK